MSGGGYAMYGSGVSSVAIILLKCWKGKITGRRHQKKSLAGMGIDCKSGYLSICTQRSLNFHLELE